MKHACIVLLLLLTTNLALAQVDTDKFTPNQSKLPVPAPRDAIVLFDGKDTNLFLSMAGNQRRRKATFRFTT